MPGQRLSGRRWRGPVTRVLLLCAVGPLLGVLAGLVWHWVWTPPTGAAWQGEFYLDPQGVPAEVAGTGWFTVIGLVVGIAFGTLAALRSRDRELWTLFGVVLGSLLLAWVMMVVGNLVGPPDPHEVARSTGDWEPIVADLRLAGVQSLWLPYGSSALLTPAVGALLGLTGIFVGGAGRPRGPGARQRAGSVG